MADKHLDYDVLRKIRMVIRWQGTKAAEMQFPQETTHLTSCASCAEVFAIRKEQEELLDMETAARLADPQVQTRLRDLAERLRKEAEEED